MTQEALDIGILIVTTLSALGVLASAIYAAKAAKAAKASGDLSLRMFEEQKEEREKMRKAAFATESSKLHRSIYFLMGDFHNEKNRTVEQERRIAFELKPILELSYNKLDRVDISVFSQQNQSDITYVHVNIGHRIAELNEVSSNADPVLDNIYSQLFGLSSIIMDRLQSSSIEENEITK